MTYTAQHRRGRATTVALIILSALLAWLIRHVWLIYNPQTSMTSLNYIWLLSFVSIIWTNLLALLEKPYTATMFQQDKLDKLDVVVVIPAYNEDERLLAACIKSVLQQSRKPSHIEVVDDGSNNTYPKVRRWLNAQAANRKYAVSLRWTRTDNGGKRHAQAIAIRNNPQADIYLTLDSDTVLDPEAIAEGLRPFADSTIQSVAGVCLAINIQENLLTRFTGLWETMWQLVDRSAQSRMKCVTVNSGILAFYRGKTIRHYLKSYLSETFFDKQVKFSDDSLMTLYSLHHGRTVQQPTAIAFSAVPNRYSHHIRRYVRWMRGSFIRSWWRFKYLPLTSYIYWLHLWKWIQFGLSMTATIYLFASGTILRYEVIPYLIAVPVMLSYIQSLRYFVIRRSDESRGQQILTFLTAPLAMLWLLTVMRLVKWYAYATVGQNKWGTRSKVEVGMQVQQA